MADLAETEELRFLNIWGLVKESYKVLLSHGKLFIALTLTLILIVPLCAVGLGHPLITDPIINRISWDELLLARYRSNTHAEERVDEDLHKELTKLLIVLLLYVVLLFAFSLLSTSAIVYSVACIYSEKVTSYKKVLSIVPRVWKRLIVTFFWAFLMMFVYGVLSFIAIFMVAVFVGLLFQGSDVVTGVVVWIGMLVFSAGIIYMSCVWHLGSVVSVLEDSYGVAAIRKAWDLIKGKQIVAFCLFFMYSLLTFVIGLSFGMSVVHGYKIGIMLRVVLGCTLILLLSMVDLFGFIVQTIFYFACKSHHLESIDRLQLSEHLGAYLGEYVPLKGAIQLEHFEP